jgi:hypothetical protein
MPIADKLRRFLRWVFFNNSGSVHPAPRYLQRHSRIPCRFRQGSFKRERQCKLVSTPTFIQRQSPRHTKHIRSKDQILWTHFRCRRRSVNTRNHHLAAVQEGKQEKKYRWERAWHYGQLRQGVSTSARSSSSRCRGFASYANSAGTETVTRTASGIR